MNVHELTPQQKKDLLTKAVIQLKQEFIGIDGIIDEVADIMLPWWLFPNLQIRPLIINLWGMTGSGKTALIKRLCELIHYNNFLMRFDMGEFGNSSSFLKYTFTRNLVQFNETSPVILLDEFQFAKTIDESGKEVNNNALRIIWDLLDSGELVYESDGTAYYLSMARKVLKVLKGINKRNIKIKNGLVNQAEAQEIFSTFTTNLRFGYEVGEIDRSEGKIPFKPEEIFLTDIFCTGIFEINNQLFNSWKDIADEIKGMNSMQEIIDYIQLLVDNEGAFKKMDVSKSLIFVVGNLDEAFAMSGTINPDIDADEYRRFTEKITIADIKTALQSRFRNEQIARLGNNHLVYHAFSHKNFEDLIKLLLGKVAILIKTKFNLAVSFTQTVQDIIYAEGVFPTQGTRPLMSTVRNLIESNIAKIILYVEERKTTPNKIVWDYVNNKFEIKFYKGKDLIGNLKLPFLQKINKLRESVKDNMQSLVAVHEAGHALAAMLHIGIVPEYVVTRTVDSESNGFAYVVLPEELVTRQLLLDKIVLALGGYAAEQLIFGASNNTTGVHGDLLNVSAYSHQIVREFGMAGEPYKMNIHVYGGNPYNYTFSEVYEEYAKQIVMTQLNIIDELLIQHKPLLLTIANYLSDNSRLDKIQLEQMANDYCKQYKLPALNFLTKETYYSFRKELKKQVSGLGKKSKK
jgi:hypothetical protein